jgi:D-glycero-D-manno-heptose 1,7-bisphosphate phosphatase
MAMTDQAMRRGLLLDRDGVINVDKGYVHKKEDFEFIPGIFDLVREATKLDYAIVVITNQSGIGRGYYSEEDFHELMGWVTEKFVEHGGRVDGVYFCPDDPSKPLQDGKAQTRRKPDPAMVLEAQRDFFLDLNRSILVGDKLTDIQAGQSAGIAKLFLLSNDEQVMEGIRVNDLLAVLSALHQEAIKG